jgi:cyclopropane fatty-acyl-phospholipid synthase-like methyltransferase
MNHRSAGPSHYDWEAPTYDLLNETIAAPLNRLLTAILRKRGAKTVLDLACGTGSQVLWLARRGFRVVGCDINRSMLRIARRKARETRLNVDLRRGDMRTFRAGPFDAAVTISNAVGHLTRSDFSKAMRNVRANLATGGVYVFDIYNLDFLRRGDNLSRLTVDWIRKGFRHVQYSTLDAHGVLASFTTILSRTVTRNVTTLQVYTTDELKVMLRRSGFRRVRHLGVDGSRFSKARTERMLTIAEA